MNEVVIRKGKISDLAVVQKLNQELFEFEVGWHNTYNKEWPYLERGMQFFTDRLNEVDGVIYLAIIDGIVVGYLCGGWLRAYTFRKERMFSQLENMYIKEGYRSKGIGEELMKEFITWSKTKGVEVMRVEAVFENEKALTFYKNKGFKEHSVILEMKLNEEGN